MESPSEHLLRSLRITATARFIGAKRLRKHEAWSLWSISFASLLLLFIPLFKPFGIEVHIPESIINISQVVAAAVILVASILVNGSKFGERAELMHSCALDINSICRRLEQAIHDNTAQSTLDQFRREYENLLAKHENHSDLDFLVAQIRRLPVYYKITWFDRLKAQFQHHASYSPYLGLMLLEIWFIYVMLVGAGQVFYDPLTHLVSRAVIPTSAPVAVT